MDLRVLAAHSKAITAAGFEVRVGRYLPADLRLRGLVDIRAACEIPIISGDSPHFEWMRLTFAQMAGPTGDSVVPREVLQEWNDVYGQPDQVLPGMAMVGVWARRPH
ncbi:hypothetical protein [Saccharopolyspora soli]|uniref:hypothetical protein n=1 Tax=Saccharopolyspora soli TaxID=2926618 RepID=UPI001F58A888|nr:hypothetical protein [Saccharopolyspora soli]